MEFAALQQIPLQLF